MTLLVIAPFNEDLRTLPDEVAGIVNVIPDARIVQGDDVDEAKIMAMVHSLWASDARLDGFWFCGHGTSEGFPLSKGKFLSVSAITQYVSMLSPDWVFFNSCESDQIVSSIQEDVSVDIISVNGSVKDADAYRTAKLFAIAYRASGNVRAALSKSAPGGIGIYRYWPTMKTKSTSPRVDPDAERYAWEKLENSVDRLLMAVFGSHDLGNYRGVQDEIVEIWKTVKELEEYRGRQGYELREVSEKQKIIIYTGIAIIVASAFTVVSVLTILTYGAGT